MTPAREHILALVSGLPSARRYARLICMLQAFFDGSTEHGKALIFAGYLGTVDAWLGFSDDWAELLTLRPRMVPFKMNEAAATGQMERAMFHYRAIERAKIFGVCCAIPTEPLAKVVRELNIDPAWNNPYYLAWPFAITLALDAAQRLGLVEPIEFVFDDQSDKVQVMKAWDSYYETAPRKYRNRIKGAPSFKQDDDVYPLQAADLLAWWARKQYVADSSRMKDLFPADWSDNKNPSLLAAVIPEEGIRMQMLKNIEATRRKQSELRLSATLRSSVPYSWKAPPS